MILKEAAAKPGNKAQLNPAIDLHWLQTRPLIASPVKKKKKACLSFFKPVQAMSSHLLTKLTDSNIRKEQD